MTTLLKHTAWIFVVIALALAGPASAKEKHKETKKGILLVAFGTSVPAAEAAFANIGKNVAATFPNVPVKWAYTSSVIRRKLAKQGRILDSVETALAKMMDEGYTHVAVQSLHTIQGEEYDNLLKTVQAFRHMPEGFEKLETGTPLLTSEADLVSVSKAMNDNISAKRRKNEAVIFMGHGSPHPSNVYYTALMHHLQKKDPLSFVATVEGSPEDRKSTRLNSSHNSESRMPSSA
jgi:sirohydrochlorin cobaltochelatase